MSEITHILDRVSQGEPAAAEELWRLVYDELRKIAAVKMSPESATQTLQPTALVHEAWLRLGGDTQPTWKNRAHFFSAAAEAMRRSPATLVRSGNGCCWAPFLYLRTRSRRIFWTLNRSQTRGDCGPGPPNV